MIFPSPGRSTLSLAAISLTLAVPVGLSGVERAAAQEASITVRTGPAYGTYYSDDYDGPGYRTRYYYDDEPTVEWRAYSYDRDNLRSDRRVRRFIDRQREDRAGGEN